MEPVAGVGCSSGMKRLLAVIAVALVVPAAAQAKEVTGFALCGPEECERVNLAGLGGHDPIDGASARRDGPPPSRFYRLDLFFDADAAGFSTFYEPKAGLVATAGAGNALMWARLMPGAATAIEQAARRVEPFPAPTFTEAQVGDRFVQGDSYARLLVLQGASVVPKSSIDAEVIQLVPDQPNPWTRTRLVYYPSDDVILRGADFVKLPADLAADIAAARPLGTVGDGTSIPWLPIGVALLGAALLVAVFLRTNGPGAGARGRFAADDECRDVGRRDSPRSSLTAS